MAKDGGNAGQNKYGSAGYKHKGGYRFNPNPTRSSHPSCQIALRSRVDKDKFLNSPRLAKYSSEGKVRAHA